MTRHPDVGEEQAMIDHAYACIVAMRSRTEGVLQHVDLAATEVDTEVARWHLERRLASIDDDVASLCFGRIDEHDGDRWYVGRRHVEDGDGTEVVVDWRAPVSTPFYRATVQDPQGLRLRRRFSLEGRTLIDILEEDFDDPDAAQMIGGIPDPLLAELERSRTGEMRDIVATIASEQDIVIRSPLDSLLVVQGGPGTGKTAVALHRAAFLLYEHRATLQDKQVLVLGPNPVFLRYISGVLPSLGETAVRQTTLEGLVEVRYPVTRTEPGDVARLKGDRRMAGVLAAAIAHRIRPPTEQVLLSTPWGRVRLEPGDVASVIDEVRSRGVPHAVGREAFRTQLLHRAYEIHERVAMVPALKARFTADTRADKGFQATINRAWPAISPMQLVRQVLTSRAALTRAAGGVLDADEVRLLLAAAARDGWSRADIPLVDEADAQLNGVRATYGHVVVDEAQDLSAMAVRMAARRSPGGSMTIVGDLAQATEPWSQERWEDVVELVAPDVPAAIEELSVGYRVPGPILALANRLLASAAPHVRPARSVRETGDAPHVIHTDDVDVTVADEAARLAGLFGSVAVIAPGDLTAIEAALDRHHLAWAAGARVGSGERVTLLAPVAAKGLEFDAVVVVEPAEIVASSERGRQALFVAMTRAVQHLTIVHSAPLPAELL
jgi:DNA helicase IV